MKLSAHGIAVCGIARCVNDFRRAVLGRLRINFSQKCEKPAFYFANLTNYIYICPRGTRKDLNDNNKHRGITL